MTVAGPQIARDLARQLLHNPQFVEPGLILQQTPRVRNGYGEWAPGVPVILSVDIVNIPVSGQDRKALPEGLRDEDWRKFYWEGQTTSLRVGQSDGNLIVAGRYGSGQSVFSGVTEAGAETDRDVYNQTNPGWQDQFENDSTRVIRLDYGGGFYFQQWDGQLGEFVAQTAYRAIIAQNWGGFTKIMAVRQDPGRVK